MRTRSVVTENEPSIFDGDGPEAGTENDTGWGCQIRVVSSVPLSQFWTHSSTVRRRILVGHRGVNESHFRLPGWLRTFQVLLHQGSRRALEQRIVTGVRTGQEWYRGGTTRRS